VIATQVEAVPREGKKYRMSMHPTSTSNFSKATPEPTSHALILVGPGALSGVLDRGDQPG
jgi:hypothetical protein